MKTLRLLLSVVIIGLVTANSAFAAAAPGSAEFKAQVAKEVDGMKKQIQVMTFPAQWDPKLGIHVT